MSFSLIIHKIVDFSFHLEDIVSSMDNQQSYSNEARLIERQLRLETIEMELRKELPKPQTLLLRLRELFSSETNHNEKALLRVERSLYNNQIVAENSEARTENVDIDNETRRNPWMQNSRQWLIERIIELENKQSDLEDERDRMKNERDNLRSIKHSLEEEREKMVPLFNIGWHIRNRKMAQEYIIPNQKQVRWGNWCGHGSDPIADSTLYLPESWDPRLDDNIYHNVYGVTWRTVWAMRDCKLFIELVTEFGDLNSYHWDNFERTKFYCEWQRTVAQWYPEVCHSSSLPTLFLRFHS